MESLSNAQQSVTSAIVTISEMGFIQSVDQRTCTLFGYSPDELHGKKINVLIPPPYKEQHDTYLENYFETGVKKIIGKNRQVEGLHKDGSIFPIMLSVTEVKVIGIRMFIGAIEKVPDKSVILVSDVNGIVVSCTRACEDLLGYTVPELVGKSINILMSGQHSQMHDTYIRDNYHNGGMLKMLGHVRNLPIRHKNGIVFPVCIQVLKVTSGGVVTFRAKIETPPKETVFTIDEEGNISSCNFTFVRPMFGYTYEFLIGQNISLLIPELDLRAGGAEEEEKGTRKRKSASGGRMEDWITETVRTVTVRHTDGSEFPVNMELSILKPDEKGNVFYSLKIKSVGGVEALIVEEPDTDYPQAEVIGDYKMTKFLGRGTYGMVRMGVHKTSQKRIAVKIIKKDQLDGLGYQRALREVKILQQLDHPHVAKLSEVIEKKDALFLMIEYCGGGDLQDFMRRDANAEGFEDLPRDSMVGKPLSEAKARRVFQQLASAVQYCHSLNIIHRDIKHKNILFDNRGNVKLIDFGLSNWACGGVMSFCGTPAYASPEMLLGTQYMGPEVDVWSLGILLYSLVTGKLPFMNVVDIVKQNYSIPNDLTPECTDLIRKCLLIDLTKRATVNDIMTHPWMLNTDTADTYSDPQGDLGYTFHAQTPSPTTFSSSSSSSSTSLSSLDFLTSRHLTTSSFLSSSNTAAGIDFFDNRQGSETKETTTKETTTKETTTKVETTILEAKIATTTTTTTTTVPSPPNTSVPSPTTTTTTTTTTSVSSPPTNEPPQHVPSITPTLTASPPLTAPKDVGELQKGESNVTTTSSSSLHNHNNVASSIPAPHNE